MDTPNYFLADLPPEAELTPALIAEACLTLRRNRERYLAYRPTSTIVNVLARLGQDWQQPDFPQRAIALSEGPAATGFSAVTIERGLDAFFRQLTVDNLNLLLAQELGHEQRLDRFHPGADNVAALAAGPELLAHIAGGMLPNPTMMSLILGLLARSAQFIKLPTGGAFLPRLFAHALHEAEPKLGACLELACWPGGRTHLETALFQEANCITATGSDETLAALHRQVPHGKRFLTYGHRVSFGYVAQSVLNGHRLQETLERAATDVVAWDQLGCLSPHVLYVENGKNLPPAEFADLLAAELERREALEPRGRLSVEAAAAIASRRSFYEVRAAHSSDTRMWCSQRSTAWTVILEHSPLFQMSCLNRFVYVKPVENLTEALQGADSVRGRVSTVGVAGTTDQAHEFALHLARWGVTRVCPLGRMQTPPLTWRHDGRPPLGDLLAWTNWEPQ